THFHAYGGTRVHSRDSVPFKRPSNAFDGTTRSRSPLIMRAYIHRVSLNIQSPYCHSDNYRPTRNTLIVLVTITITVPRSEEHASGLQSRFDLVGRLLL